MNKLPWGEDCFYKREAQWINFCRGGIRRIANRYPEKVAFMKENRFKMEVNRFKNGRAKIVYGATCAECNQDFQLKFLQVDHINAVGSFDLDLTMRQYFTSMFPHRSEYQWLCNEKGNGCHDIKSYKDNMLLKGHNLSDQDAINAKKWITTKKLKATPLKAFMKKHKASEENMRNKATRDEWLKDKFKIWW